MKFVLLQKVVIILLCGAVIQRAVAAAESKEWIAESSEEFQTRECPACTRQYRCSQCERAREKEKQIVNAAVAGAVNIVNATLSISLADRERQPSAVAAAISTIASSIANVVLASTRTLRAEALGGEEERAEAKGTIDPEAFKQHVLERVIAELQSSLHTK